MGMVMGLGTGMGTVVGWGNGMGGAGKKKEEPLVPLFFEIRHPWRVLAVHGHAPTGAPFVKTLGIRRTHPSGTAFSSGRGLA
jgi:hypothetical protein